MCCKWFLHIRWNISQFRGYHQFVEVSATSQRKLSLYDICAFVFWSACHHSCTSNHNTVIYPKHWRTTVSQIGMILKNIYITLQALEMCVLLAMSLDRYLAIVHPFFYQARITKGRIVKFIIFIQLTALATPILCYLHRVSYMQNLIYIYVTTGVALFFSMICYMNYKIFVIARNKLRATHDSSIEFKRNSTCVWVIACFLISSIPVIAYNALKFGASNVIQNENFWTTFRLWSFTIATMNCTFNCIILFWRNRFLRRKIN